MVKLFEIIEKPITGEWGKNDDVGNGIPVLRTTNFTNEGHINYSKVVTRKINSSKIKNKLLRTSDIIIEKSGGGPDQPVGRVVYFEGEPNKYLSNNFTSILRITDKATCNAKYLFYQLWWYHKTGKTNSYQNKTTGISNLKLDKYVRELDIRLPSILSQNMIVKTLDSVIELLALRKQQLAELDNLTKSIFYDMFGDPVINEKGWETGKIKDLALKIQYGTSAKASSERLSRFSVPILRMNNITYQGSIDLTDLKYVDLDEKQKEKYLVYKGDMLFNRTNSKELVGKTAVFREEKPMAYAGYLVRLVPNEKANSEFISAYLNSIYGKKLLMKMAKNIVGMANINAQEMSNIDIYIPPIELQNKFADTVMQIEKHKTLINKAITETQYLFDSLMSEYFD